MSDFLTPEQRSQRMARVRSRDTKPERTLRALLRAEGATGYRLHRRDLPGRPDIAFGRWKVAVFVDGGFWHGHPSRFNPEAVSEFWRKKITRNQERDREVDAALIAAGWMPVRVWDHELDKAPGKAVQRVLRALRGSGWS